MSLKKTTIAALLAASGIVVSSAAMAQAKSADQASRFEAGAIKKANLPKTIDVTQDNRFKILT